MLQLSRFVLCALLVTLLQACGDDGPGGPLRMAVDSFCEKSEMCQLGTAAQCEQTLFGAIGGGGPEACENAAAAWINCLGGLSCEQLPGELQQFDLCATEFDAADAVCE